jgi:DNA polymerase-3 subunit epsilon
MDHEYLLKTLLDEIQHGVLICNHDAKISLANQAAADLFGREESIATGDSLYSFCLQAPAEHARDLLLYQVQENLVTQNSRPAITFMNMTIGQEKFLRCRMNLLQTQADSPDSFIIIMDDASAWYQPDNQMSVKIEEFRAPMTNLRAAVENLTEHPDMSPVMRSAFENILVQESLNLTGAFDSLTRTCDLQMQAQNHLTEINLEVFCRYLEKHFQENTIPFSAAAHPEAAVKVDSFALLKVLDFLVARIQQERNLSQVTCETPLGKKFLYINFIWKGELLSTSAVETILAEILKDSIGSLPLASILHTMGGDIWSQQLENSYSILRLALPLAQKTDKKKRDF